MWSADTASERTVKARAAAASIAWAQEAYVWPFDKRDTPIKATSSYVTVYSAGESVAVAPPHQLDWSEFQEYVIAWKKSRPKASSSAIGVAFDPNYLRIIAMADKAVPCLLKQLHMELEFSEPDHWFVALWSITGANPVPPESRGKMREMAKAWIEWGKQRGLLDAGVGKGFSQSW